MDQQQSFLDSKTVLAIVLVGVVWFGWQSYMTNKYPKPAPEASTPNQENKSESAAVVPQANETKSRVVLNEGEATEAFFKYEDGNLSFVVGSFGMGIESINIKRYSDRKGDTVMIGSSGANRPLTTAINDKVLKFEITKSGDSSFVGVTKLGELTITKTITVEKSYLLSVNMKFEGATPPSTNVRMLISEDSVEHGLGAGKNMEQDPALWQSFFVSYNGTSEHIVASTDKPALSSYEKVLVASLSGKYFGQAFVDESPIVPTLRTELSASKEFLGWLEYSLNVKSPIELSGKFYAGPKSLDLLRSTDVRLEGVVNYGMFGWLASPLLHLMQWLYELTRNYGVAIVLMTLLVRLAVMPFNLASYKSMKAMQIIQPQINKLKEKYKDDAQAMNKEMMRLMKENNANPLMGCLPMLLQLPVFFALYQVLDQSVELYKAPFALWITDLSLKDPYFVLPVLMGITMFIQQKITPTTLDPAQARVMMIMPLVFAGLMLTLPSGLTLYIFISTLFGIIQQLIFMRDRKTATAAAVQAKA